jgi:hypothetical protein
MKRFFVFSTLFLMVTHSVCLAAEAGRGEQLLDVKNSIYCLADAPFQLLGRRKSKAISLIVSRDDLSYRDEQHLWLFIMQGQGVYDVFDMQMKRNPRKGYELRNSATVKWDGKSVDDFGSPLLGGIWAHNVMRMNFRKALRSKPIMMKALGQVGEKPLCGSYTNSLGLR